MGNKYSQISTDLYPSHYFILIFRQPDVIQAINAEIDLIDNLTQVFENFWPFGIKTEKKIRFGIELKLNNNPLSNDPKPLEKLLKTNQLICEILSTVLSCGYGIVSSGYIIKSFERSTLIFRKLNVELKIHSSSICSIILEGWNRIIVNNINEITSSFLLKEITSLAMINILSLQSSSNYLTIELDGQPWDSHKLNSVKSPLIFLNLICLLMQCGYKVMCKAHLTGYNDTVFFERDSDKLVIENEIFLLSLNQLDQLRTYCATSEAINAISRVIKSQWEKGIHNDSIQDKIWVCYLNGSPWSVANWDKDSSFSSKLLMMDIFKELSKNNWEIILSIKLYRSQYDKSLFVFQRNLSNKDENHFFSIGPHDIDRLCITGSPKGLLAQLKDRFSEHWIKGIKEDSYENGCNEYIMEGKPWHLNEESSNVNLDAIGFFCWALEHISDFGWSLVETADICSTSAYSPTDYIFSKV